MAEGIFLDPVPSDSNSLEFCFQHESDSNADNPQSLLGESVSSEATVLNCSSGSPDIKVHMRHAVDSIPVVRNLEICQTCKCNDFTSEN